MYAGVAIVILTALVWKLFGSLAARVFLGASMGVLATLLCVVMGVTVIDMSSKAKQPQIVRMGPSR